MNGLQEELAACTAAARYSASLQVYLHWHVLNDKITGLIPEQRNSSVQRAGREMNQLLTCCCATGWEQSVWEEVFSLGLS
jgi:hypothetical protein